MPTRWHVRSTSSRMWLERKTVAPSATASRTSWKKVCWTRGSRPAVGSSRISSSGRCWRAMTSPTFCLFALRVLAEAARRVEVEPRHELRLPPRIDAAPEVAVVLDRLAARQAVEQRELAGQVAHASMNGDRIDGRLDPEDPGLPGGRPDKVEEQPDRRRLAGAVRPEEAEDLALLDRQVDVDDPPMLAVVLRQALGLDDGHRGRPPVGALDPRVDAAALAEGKCLGARSTRPLWPSGLSTGLVRCGSTRSIDHRSSRRHHRAWAA